VRPERTDLYSIPLGLTRATIGVEFPLDATCLSRHASLALGIAVEPDRVALTCTAHFVPDGNFATKSAAPLLPCDVLTLAPLFRRD
jgi:hypothetical protein